MSDLTPSRRGAFEIGRVFGRAAKALRAHFWTFSLLAFLSLVIAFAVQVVCIVLIGIVAEASSSNDQVTAVFSLLTLCVMPPVIGLTLSLLLQAGLQAMSGQKPTIGNAFSAAWANILPVGTIFILTLACLVLGNILIFVGTMLLMAWFVAIPARISEKIGIFQSFSRSLNLTRGHRWPIFGLYLLTLLINFGALIIISIVFTMVSWSSMSSVRAGGGQMPTSHIITTLILYTIFPPIFLAANSLVLASTYVELKTLKEGSADRSIADLFS